jgi:hypothetical protein
MELQEIINRLMVTASALERDGNHGTARAFARLAEEVKNSQKRQEETPSQIQMHYAEHD